MGSKLSTMAVHCGRACGTDARCLSPENRRGIARCTFTKVISIHFPPRILQCGNVSFVSHFMMQPDERSNFFGKLLHGFILTDTGEF